jgi:hypothetical protein
MSSPPTARVGSKTAGGSGGTLGGVAGAGLGLLIFGGAVSPEAAPGNAAE